MSKPIQPLFIQFHNAIKLDRPAGVKKIIKERERLVHTLKQELATVRLYFDHFNQGSYAMGTAILPTNGRDYDLDTGLVFDFPATQYPDPTELKQVVMNVIKELVPRTIVEMKDPCIQVDYNEFHLDFAIYAQHPHPESQGVQLAWGRRGAQHKSWENANPKKLVKLVNNKYKGKQNYWKRAQFIRIVRYLKRWKDQNFPKKGNAAPTGILLTALVYEWMHTKRDKDGQPNDLHVLMELLKSAGNHHYGVGYSHKFNLPIQSPKALFEDMQTGKDYIVAYQKKMGALRSTLKQAKHHWSQNNPQKAVQALKEQFGNDFPTL